MEGAGQESGAVQEHERQEGEGSEADGKAGASPQEAKSVSEVGNGDRAFPPPFDRLCAPTITMDPEKLPLQPVAAPPARHARSKQGLLVIAALALAAIHGARCWLNSSTTAAQPGGSIWWSQCPDDSTTYCSFLNVPLGALVSLVSPSPSLSSSSAPSELTLARCRADYTDPKADEFVSLSLRMIPATVPPKKQLGYLLCVSPSSPLSCSTSPDSPADALPLTAPTLAALEALVRLPS